MPILLPEKRYLAVFLGSDKLTICNLTKKSKFLSLILRHKPEKGNIKLDKYGYAHVEDILKSLNITLNELDEIVSTDTKGRYSYNSDKTKIRANQGHSINVDLCLKEVIPPKILFHGTAQKSLESIMEKGILKMSRQYVHLSKDYNTALIVGKRHGNPIVLKIDTSKMLLDGFSFYLSENGVYLTEHVPAKYISIVNT